MRTDRIDDKALQQAYDLMEFSEKGGPNFHNTGIRAEDVPVLSPQVSKLKKEDEPWQPDSAFYGNKPKGSGPPSFNYGEEQGTGAYNSLNRTLRMMEDELENLGGQLRRARQIGNFRMEHEIVQKRDDLLKQKSAIEAQMMVNDLGRFQNQMNNDMMYKSQNMQDLAKNPAQQFSEFVEKIEENDQKIARLEEMLLEYAELKSAGGDSNADPGQSYSPEDDEEDDEEEIDNEDAIGYAEIEIEIDTENDDEEEDEEEEDEEV